MGKRGKRQHTAAMNVQDNRLALAAEKVYPGLARELNLLSHMGNIQKRKPKKKRKLW